MLRIGIGVGVAFLAYFAVLGYGKRQFNAGYSKGQAEIARALQKDAAEKERLAIEAEDAVSPTPDDPQALAKLCEADTDCRDREAKK